jgi:hypothetical protein
MPIPIICDCGAKLKVGDHLGGRSIRCPPCGALHKVPGGDDSDVEDDLDEDFEDEPKKKARPVRSADEVLEESSLSAQQQEMVSVRLRKGEKLVWVGQPVPKISVLRVLIPAIALGVFATIGVTIAMFFTPDMGTIRWLIPVAVPFVSAVAGIGGAVYQAWRAKKTFYALTDRRAIVWDCSYVGKVSPTDYDPATVAKMRRMNAWFVKGAGDLVFHSKTVTTKTRYVDQRGNTKRTETSSYTIYYGFLAIADAAEVEQLVREALIEPYVAKLTDDEDEDED